MFLHTSLSSLQASLAGSAVCATIGNFDGVHMGHQVLLQKVRNYALAHGMKSLVVTFWPHPLAVLRGTGPKLIASHSQKEKLLQNQGIDAALEIAFTRELARLTPREFLRQWLLPLQLKHLIIGYDFSLGKNRTGNAEALASIGKEEGFSVEQILAVKKGGEIVSSTRIRHCLEKGISVAALMEQPFQQEWATSGIA